MSLAVLNQVDGLVLAPPSETFPSKQRAKYGDLTGPLKSSFFHTFFLMVYNNETGSK